MRRGFLLLLSFFTLSLQAYAFELVYPTEKKVFTTSDYAFFVGSTKGSEGIKIDGESVYVAPNGAFAHSVKLKEGENRIMIRSDYGGLQGYKFYKTTNTVQELPLEEFEPQRAVVNSDNVPLRSTPVDAGLNRISHLFKGTNIIVNGSKGSFYRVFLAKNKEGWIAKKDVTTYACDDNSEIAEFITMDSKRYKNAMIQNISFTKKLPYTIDDNEKEIVLRVYNPELSEDSVYNLNIPKPEKYLYSVVSNGGDYTFKVKKLPDTPQEITVAIDAGHGGTEKGAIGCLGDEEKDINLKIAQELCAQLKKEGYNVVMTRDCDCNISLDDRVKFAKENEADIFVSIHLNSIGNVEFDVHKHRGTSVYYFNDSAKKLAECIELEVPKTAKTREDGVKTASFAVIRPYDYVGVLVETAYMTNPMDSVLYRQDKFIKNAAKGIVKGINKYISE